MNTVISFTAQDLIAFAGLCAAIAALAGYIFKARDWVKKQDKQDEKIEALAKRHEEDMRDSLDERQLIIYGVLACLKGLKEQGCNGPVTEAINKIEKHLNKKAHE